MGILTRRSVFLAGPAAALGAAGTAALAAPAAHAAAPNILMFTAKRTKATLENLPAVAPALGTPFIAYLDLVDDTGKSLGDGSVRGQIVDIIVAIPPKLVVQTNVIFRITGLPDVGEIHASNMHIRTIPNPGVLHPLAITGGTAAYRTARGSGSIEHVNPTDTKVVLNVMVDPPA